MGHCLCNGYVGVIASCISVSGLSLNKSMDCRQADKQTEIFIVIWMSLNLLISSCVRAGVDWLSEM